MRENRNLLTFSLIVLVVWMIIVLGGEILQASKGSLEALVTEQIVIALIAAPLFLVGVVSYSRWDKRELGLKASQNWRILWFPVLFVLAFMGTAVAVGLPATRVVVFALINSLLVGISEELMFRGIIFRGLLMQPRIGIWPAIWITAFLFGGVHSLNGFMTGDFLSALAQALAAIMSGIWLHAIRLRTKSLYPAMLIHGLWDFSIFVFATSLAATSLASGGATEQNTVQPTLIQQLFQPLVLPLPLFLYGLWLLRGIGHKGKAEALS